MWFRPLAAACRALLLLIQQIADRYLRVGGVRGLVERGWAAPG